MYLTDQEAEWAMDAIRRAGLFSSCSEDELQLLAGDMEKRSYDTGSTILFQGEISNSLGLVESGRVTVLVKRGRDRVPVAELGPGACFGEISLLTPRTATATVKAAEPSEIVFLTGEAVRRISLNNPAVARALEETMRARLGSQQQNRENT